MTNHRLLTSREGKKYSLMNNKDGSTHRVYLKACKICDVYRIPMVAERNICFRCKLKEKLARENAND